jgi:20S proteasome subunit alpha 4
MLIIGFDLDKTPRLFLTDPSGIYSEWKANSIGRNSKNVREFLEKNHEEDMDRYKTVKLAIKSLLEVVQTGAKNIEIAVMTDDSKVEFLELDELDKFVKEIEKEKEEEAEKKKALPSSSGRN